MTTENIARIARIAAVKTAQADFSGRNERSIRLTQIGDYVLVDDGGSAAWIALAADWDTAQAAAIAAIEAGDYDAYLDDVHELMYEAYIAIAASVKKIESTEAAIIALGLTDEQTDELLDAVGLLHR